MTPPSRRPSTPGTLRVLPGGRARAGAVWREGDPVGDRQFADLGPLDLETGGHLPAVRLAYETWGTLAADRSNAVLVEHALTGDAHVTGPRGPGHPTPGWWDTMVGPGRPIDTDRWFVVAANVVGGCQGSTGPASAAPDGRPWGSRFPYVTVRDQVTAEIALADALGIDSWALVIGGSMGGMRALEWAVMAPDRVRAVAPVATTALSSGDQIAWAHAQLTAIRSDPAWHGGDYYDVADGNGPLAGMAVARQIAHTTYRSAFELDTRFGRRAQDGEQPLGGGGRFAVQSYLDHHAGKLMGRFDPGSYVALTESILSHDVGRGRGGVAAALSTVTARTAVIGVDSDRLYLPEESEQLASALPGSPTAHLVHSDHGHDGFLIEIEQVGALVAALLDQD